MNEGSTVTAKMRMAIGTESEIIHHTVEKGAIKKIIRAMRDDNPLWTVHEIAKRSRHGEIIAPPAYLMSVPFEIPRVDMPPSLTRQVAGGSEWEFFSSTKPGDVISVKCRVSNIYEKMGKQGNMVFIIYEIIYKRRGGQKIAINRTTLIGY